MGVSMPFGNGRGDSRDASSRYGCFGGWPRGRACQDVKPLFRVDGSNLHCFTSSGTLLRGSRFKVTKCRMTMLLNTRLRRGEKLVCAPLTRLVGPRTRRSDPEKT